MVSGPWLSVLITRSQEGSSVLKTQLNWTTDEFGRASVGGIHDGRIVSFAFAESDCFSLGILGEANRLVEIELSGIADMNVRDLCNGSIVSTVYVWSVRSVPLSTWDLPNSGWNLLFSNRYSKPDAKEFAARIALKRPQSKLVQVECSYGGSVAVVCDEVSIFVGSAKN